jgi:hypothetical protein
MSVAKRRHFSDTKEGVTKNVAKRCLCSDAGSDACSDAGSDVCSDACSNAGSDASV